MTRRGTIGLGLLVFLFAGCALPQWRVGQTKVPANNSEKPAAQIEGERQGAAYIRDLTAPPVGQPGAVVASVHEVATSLAASLGEPKKAVSGQDKDAIIASLRGGLAAKDRQLEQWKQFGRKYGGTPLEGTGINLAGPAGLVGLVAVVALCVFFPPVGYALLRLLPVLWGYFRRTTAAINEMAAANPAAAADLKDRLARRMDEAHKRLVRRWAAPGAPPSPSSSP